MVDCRGGPKARSDLQPTASHDFPMISDCMMPAAALANELARGRLGIVRNGRRVLRVLDVPVLATLPAASLVSEDA